MRNYPYTIRFFCTLILLAAAGARAQFAYEEYDHYGRAYFQIDAGGVLAPNFKLTSFDGPIANPSTSLDPGVRFDFVGGWEFIPDLAVELETGFLWNSADKIGGEELSPVELDLYQTPLLVNLVYSWPIRKDLTAYVGGGAGGVFTTADFFFPGFGDLVDTDAAFGYQGIAGLRYALTDNGDIGVSYKFLGTSNHSWDDAGIRWTANAILTHSILASFSMRF